jgi:hypothetical protein
VKSCSAAQLAAQVCQLICHNGVLHWWHNDTWLFEWIRSSIEGLCSSKAPDLIHADTSECCPLLQGHGGALGGAAAGAGAAGLGAAAMHHHNQQGEPSACWGAHRLGVCPSLSAVPSHITAASGCSCNGVLRFWAAHARTLHRRSQCASAVCHLSLPEDAAPHVRMMLVCAGQNTGMTGQNMGQHESLGQRVEEKLPGSTAYGSNQVCDRPLLCGP